MRSLEKMKKFVFAVILLSVCSLFSANSVFAQVASNQLNNASSSNVAKNTLMITSPTRMAILPLDEIKPGMKGIARTVFSGTEPEEFGVEILGIMPGFIGPKQGAIIARLSGKNAERTRVFAGMSGSPVFIDGKLVGAIAYSFPFSLEPIAGITPIQEMIRIFEDGAPNLARQSEPKAVTEKQLASTDLNLVFPKRNFAAASFLGAVSLNSPMYGLLGQQVTPIATPLTFGGFNQETINQFAPMLTAAGLQPVSAMGATSEISPLEKFDDNTLKPGDSVAMQLTRGDFSLAAAGTVTFRDGDKVYAFGHPFLSLGVADLPMSDAPVVTVIPNANNSFKLATPRKMYGAMTQDRNTAVLGKLGQQAKMIPVKMSVATSRNQSETYNYEVASDSFLTPLLLNITTFNGIGATERGLGEATVTIKGEIRIKGENEPIKIERRFSAMNASAMAAGSVAVPASLLLNGGFDNVQISGVNLQVSSLDISRTASLDRISLSRTQIKAGETLDIQTYIRTDTGKVIAETIPVQIPKDAPEGNLLVYVGDGNALQQVAPSRSFVPKTVGELIKTINDTKKNDRLYVQLVRVTNGAVIGSNSLPNLPPSVLATINSDRAVGGVTPTIISPIFEKELPASEFVVSGQQVLVVEVIR